MCILKKKSNLLSNFNKITIIYWVVMIMLIKYFKTMCITLDAKEKGRIFMLPYDKYSK